MKTTPAARFDAVCACCFGTFNLSMSQNAPTRNPIRHGFNIVGGHGQGHAGGWHTGPCAGVGFPHFGISTAGTERSLGLIEAAIAQSTAALAALEARPNLDWKFQPTKYVAATWTVRKSSYTPHGEPFVRVLVPGTEAETITYTQPKLGYNATHVVPSYETELTIRIGQVQARLDGLGHDQKRFATAIKNWKPTDAVQVTKAPAIVHLAKTVPARDIAARNNVPTYTIAAYDRPACKVRLPSYKLSAYTTTHNPAEVTCKRCK